MDITDEAQIRQQRELWKDAFEASDVERVMSFYAPEIVAFDIMPPLQFADRNSYESNWVNFLHAFDGKITLEVKNLTIACAGDVAFVCAFTRLTGTMQGQSFDSWTRETNGLRKIDGAWLVVHDHVSVPVDFSTGKALLDLKP